MILKVIGKIIELYEQVDNALFRGPVVLHSIVVCSIICYDIVILFETKL